jgi:hypothetical protein
LLTVRATRGALAAACAGYVALGLAFSYHIHTHDYYSLPLIPLAAWSIGALMEYIGSGRRGLRRPALRFRQLIGAAVVLLAGVAVAFAWRRPPVFLNTESARQTAAQYETIGRLVDHSSRVVALDMSYGFALDYHGRLVAWNLPLGADRRAASLAGHGPGVDMAAELASGEFFVCTAQRELDALPELRDELAERYRLVARDGNAERWAYVVYDLQRRKDDRR